MWILAKEKFEYKLSQICQFKRHYLSLISISCIAFKYYITYYFQLFLISLLQYPCAVTELTSSICIENEKWDAPPFLFKKGKFKYSSENTRIFSYIKESPDISSWGGTELYLSEGRSLKKIFNLRMVNNKRY